MLGQWERGMYVGMEVREGLILIGFLFIGCESVKAIGRL